MATLRISPNFRFLVDSLRLAGEYATLAERYAYSDPNTAVIKLRQFSEVLTETIAARAGFDVGQRFKHVDLINLLARRGVLDTQARNVLHELRRCGNTAVHDGAGTPETALALLQSAHVVAKWYYQLAMSPDSMVSPYKERRPPVRTGGTSRNVSGKAAARAAELRRAFEVALAEERRRHALELHAARQDALRRAGEATSAPSVTFGRPVVDAQQLPARPRRPWHDATARPGWVVRYSTAGGRLRAVDPFSQAAAPGLAAALSHVAIFARPGGRKVSDNPDAALVSQVLFRLVGRGTRPPVDPQLETAILERAGLSASLVPEPRPGELCAPLPFDTTRYDSTALQLAALYREPFLLDGSATALSGGPLFDANETALLTDGLAGAFGRAAGQWCTARVTSTDMITGRSAPTEAAGGSLLITYPYGRPALVALDQATARTGRTRPMPPDLEIDPVTIPASAAADASLLSRRLSAALTPLDDKAPPAAMRALVWGPAVGQRVLLALAEALELGWLAGEEWCLEVREPCGIAVAAIKSAAEITRAVAAVRDVDVAPQRIHIRNSASWTCLVAGPDGTYTTQESDASVAPEGADLQLRIRIECTRGPLHRLPRPNGVAEIVVRSALLPLDLMDVRPASPVRQKAVSADQPPAWALRRLLHATFGKRDFQPAGPAPRGQEVAIRRVLAGQDTIVLLPTGAGKSLIYQLAGLLAPGATIVVDPIIALIEDQVAGLHGNGIDRAVGITSADPLTQTKEKLDRVRSGDAWFVFVSPERLQTPRFRQQLRALVSTMPVSVAVVDEAHCVSEWGHDFRPAYLDLGNTLRRLTRDATGTPPPILALTGTASHAVLKDMASELSVDRSDPHLIVRPATFDRPELRFRAVATKSADFQKILIQQLRELPTSFTDPTVPADPERFFAPRGEATTCGIVYCPTVNGSGSGVVAVSRLVSGALGIAGPIYCGTAPPDWPDFDTIKRVNATAFKANEVPVLFATKAYGMGIDKPNVRFIVHAELPASIEAYYQEAGRAGRSRQEAHCILVFTPNGRDTQEFFLQKSYYSAEAETALVRQLLEQLAPIGVPRAVSVKWQGGEQQKERERAIHRLRMLGVVADYLVHRQPDGRAGRFEVHLGPATVSSIDEALLAFVRRSQPARATALRDELSGDPEAQLGRRAANHACRMVAFVYDTIVASRRRALDEMEDLALRGVDDEAIRSRILRYLEHSDVARRLGHLVERDVFTLADWAPVYEEIETIADANDWRGATARLLESEPDHPGLLLGRALAELILPEGRVEVIRFEVERAFVAASEKYAMQASEHAALFEWLLGWVESRARHCLGIVLQLAPSVLGERHLEHLAVREWRILTDPAHHDPLVLVMILNRRLERHLRALQAIQSQYLAVTH